LAEHIQSSQKLLYRLLTKKSEPPPSSPSPGHILRLFLTNTITAITNVSMAAIREEAASVSLEQIVDIEKLIAKIIGGLEAQGMFPETSEEAELRNEAEREHTERLQHFLAMCRLQHS
jgi:hypothetical protein